MIFELFQKTEIFFTFDSSNTLELGAGSGGLTQVFLHNFKDKYERLTLVDLNEGKLIKLGHKLK